MSTSYPKAIPPAYSHEQLADAYRRGWNHGHGLACHNVPKLGSHLLLDSEGRVTVDTDNIREVHASLCFEAEANSRCYSPFEFTAHEFNSAPLDHAADDSVDVTSEQLWAAFEEGTTDAIAADLAEYTDEDYGINDEA